ncbi:MAG: c-type cytochrome, partial [Flavobacteriales bacterium]
MLSFAQNPVLKVVATGWVTILTSTVWAQLPTWVDDIAPIVHTHCARCHHNGGAGPFPLLTYEDVFFTANMDVHVMQDGEMPPWPADPDYRHFVGENVLSEQDVALFTEWYETGMAYGDESVVVELPEFGPQGTLLESLDFVADFPEYTLQSNNEEYRWFVVSTDFEETKYILKKQELNSGERMPRAVVAWQRATASR